MSHRTDNSIQHWAGLLIDSPRRSSDERSLREMLGSDSVLLVVRESDDSVRSVRAILQTRTSNVLTLMGDTRSPVMESLLKIAGTLSSLRRIVVLHDASDENCNMFRSGGILMLRDCPEIREALRKLIARESGLHENSRSLELPEMADSNGGVGDHAEDGAEDEADGRAVYSESAAQPAGADRFTPGPLEDEVRHSGSRIAPLVHRVERLHTHESPFQFRGVTA